MNISILSVFPNLYNDFLKTSLIRRASESGLVSYHIDAYSSFVAPGVRIDAPTFGHGTGMLIKPEVVTAAIKSKEEQFGRAFKIFFSPHGKKLDQVLLRRLAENIQEKNHLMLLPARYEGMDARVEQRYADEVISIGDFVLMGGDVPAMIFLEGLLRLFPGIVGKSASVEQDSFSNAFVDYPEYTEPVNWKNLEVPEIIRSGNHAAMNAWRMEQAAKRTIAHHFDWLRTHITSDEQKKMAKKIMPSHYIVLMHGEVISGPECKEGTTSVTSIDIHDIARSAKTFGVEQFFIVTPLTDQQKIVQTLLDFWQKGVGIEYNPERHKALNGVKVISNLDDVVDQIRKKEGKKPLIITTSARPWPEKNISFYDQSLVWQEERPVLFVFGTGRGLADTVMKRSDFVLLPVEGFSSFNHLSVRSAVAIILDRWMGVNLKMSN